MATPMPPGLPRQPPPSTHNPNFQQNPDSLSDNLQKLNINKPTLPPFIRSPPPPSTSAPSPPISRPGAPPPGVVPRPNMPPNVGSVIPFGAPGGQPLPFETRSPPGSLPSSKGGGPVISPVGSNAPQLIAPPSAFVPPSSALGGSIRNGPPVGVPPPMMGTVRSPGQAPNMGSFLGSPQGSYPPGPRMQLASPFSAPLAAPFGTQTRSPGQVALPAAAPDALQPPRMFGMPPLQPNQLSHAIDQTGTSLEGLRKSNSDQVPRPSPSSSIILHDTRQGNQANPPPPATSEYIVTDTGNCSPRYMRCTIYQTPCTADLLTNCGMQFALLVQPLALPQPSEEPIPVVDFGENGPIRCSRCKGYINPFMKFIDHGRRFICNFCGFIDNTPHEYQCNLGPDGRRRDADVRPELCKGTIEFVATKEYMMRDPMPAVYFFLIDVSMNAIQTGATAAACAAINQVIADLPEGPRTMVGIATFDSTIHFYNLKRALQQPLMLIVPDVQDVYIPLETDIIVQLSESRQHIEQLLESIPTMFLDNRTAESAFVAAVKAAFLAIKSTGGKLLVFQSVLPSVGMVTLSARDAEGRNNTSAGEKEVHKLLQPADKTLKTMANEFAECQVCVDVFITTQTYVDIASISLIPGTTGGQVYYYYPFSSVSDPAKLYNDLRWNITRPQGFEAVLRVRCSQGIEVKEYHGNFCKRVPTDVDLPGIDSDKTIMVTLKHDDKLQDGSECAFQCALLYTTVYGQRRIRVSTLSLPCTSNLTNLFRAADLDTLFVCSLKQVANKIPSTPLLQIQEQVTNICINNLLAYRKFCTTSTSSGQFVLPEALKLLPLYTLALTKSTGLHIDGRIDDRSFWINIVSHISIPSAVCLVLPRMIAVHNLDLEEEGGFVIPPTLPLSSEYVSEEGIYLLENGVDGLIYIGSLVDSVILQQLFGISSFDETPTQFVLQQYDNSLSKKLNRVINEIRRQWCSYLRLTLCKKGDSSGMLFFSYLIEDPNPKGGQSYSEFLVYLHRKIQSKMS
ncbi:protein transport protein Sec24-like At4g32640 [Herrania umbratica]|uniref:Protein transport protein Sec24-like At4g32640 n=1 Tax=Herrania umbratica TaxID=108875 RepID=A0A6J1A3R1_9ROSI|nr:protein transport protein Sec24-like At4g32640 [Herrania umbratica]XP_021281644.1 protein transport protein Sec24-like At4g32640 [Herrania umbratica]XP_021281645.1 protein transport protein Sec24-like At4g32640 [Herrania umbratica]